MDMSAVWTSVKTASCAMFAVFFLGVAAARGVSAIRRPKLRALADALLTLPLVLPPTVAGFFLLYIFGPRRPVGRFLLEFFGLRLVFNWPATVLAAAVIAFPLMYRSARGAFEQVDETLLFAARTLGMPEYAVFWRVLMPLALPGVAGGGILAFARALGEFGATAMIAGNIAGQTRTLPLAVYSAVAGGRMESAWAYVGILAGIAFLATLGIGCFASQSRRGRGAGGRR